MKNYLKDEASLEATLYMVKAEEMIDESVFWGFLEGF